MEYQNETLNEREGTHGDFAEVSEASQGLKAILFSEEARSEIDCLQHEALDLICTKLSRIVCGNPNEADHWKDIAGYANLVSERLEKKSS